MILFLAVSLVPLLLTVYVAYTMSESSLLGSIRSHVYSVTESRVKTIDVWMGERKNDITVLADSPVIREMERNSSHAYLTEVDRGYGGIYEELFLMDGRGDVIASTLNRTGNKKQGLIFIEPIAGTTYFSGVYFSETTGGPAITISVPVKREGKIVGVLAARVNMTRLYGMMESESRGTSEEAYIVNDAGMIISHTNRSKVLRDNINYSYAVKQVLAGNSGVGEYTGYNGNTVLGSYQWMPEYQWGLIAEYDRDQALAGIYALRRLTLVLTAFSFAVVVLSSFLFSRQITIPIHNLEGGARALTRGEYKEIPVISDDEIGRLTRIFNATSRELLDAKRKLENTVELVNRDLEVRNEELRRANIELRKLDSMKSDFISMVSHELKTPLAAIRTSAEVLEGETDPAVRREMQGIIIRNIDRQTRLINDLLDLSRIESGRLELRKEGIVLAELVKGAIRNVRIKESVQVHINIPDSLKVLADRDRLEQVIVNLLDNAMKFTEQGSVTFSARELGDSVEVSVTDTGIGIASENLGKIFDKFYQAESTMTRKTGGTGLGLAICRGIIAAHGGQIWAESSGEGSTFRFTLANGK